MKFFISGFAIADQWVPGNHLTSLDQSYFCFPPTLYFLLSNGEVGPDSSFLTFVTLMTIKVIFYIVSQYTPEHTYTKLKRRSRTDCVTLEKFF